MFLEASSLEFAFIDPNQNM